MVENSAAPSSVSTNTAANHHENQNEHNENDEDGETTILNSSLVLVENIRIHDIIELIIMIEIEIIDIESVVPRIWWGVARAIPLQISCHFVCELGTHYESMKVQLKLSA